MDNLIQELRAQFGECSICMSDFDDNKCIPMILQCQHSMCQKCIQSYRCDETIVCPFCKMKVTISSTDFGKMAIQKDRTRISLLELLHQHSSKTNRCCECNSQRSIFFCNNCANYHCKKCKNIHKENCDLRKALRAAFSGNCTEQNHEECSLRYYCSTCNLSVCAMCAFEDHRNDVHDVKDLFALYKECVLHIKRLVIRLKAKIGKTEKLGQSLKKAKSDVIKRRKQIENYADLNDKLSLKEKLLYKSEAKKAESNILHQIESWRKKCKEFSQNAVECCKTVKYIRDAKQFLSNEQCMTEKLTELAEMNLNYDVENLQDWESLQELMDEMKKLDKTKSSFFLNSNEIKPKFEWIQRPRNIRIIVVIIALSILLPLQIFLIPNDVTPGTVIPVKFEKRSIQRGCVQNNSFSTEPFNIGNQKCGRKNNFYKYKGAFLNRSYTFLKEECLEFKVQISSLETFSDIFDDLVVNMEFGVSLGTISAKYLKQFQSRSTWSWRILSDKSSSRLYFDNNHGSIVRLHYNQDCLYKYNMCFYKNHIVELWNANDNVLLDAILFRDVKQSSKLFPVFAIYAIEGLSTGVSITTPGVHFNISSASSDIYVSRNSRSLNSHKKNALFQRVCVKTSYVHTEEVNCTEGECYIPVDFYFSASKNDVYGEFGVIQQSGKSRLDSIDFYFPLLAIKSCSSLKRRWIYSDSCLVIYGGSKNMIHLIEEVWSPTKLKFYIVPERKIRVQSTGGINVTTAIQKNIESPTRLYFRAPENASIEFYIGNNFLNDIQKANYFFSVNKSYLPYILGILLAFCIILEEIE